MTRVHYLWLKQLTFSGFCRSTVTLNLVIHSSGIQTVSGCEHLFVSQEPVADLTLCLHVSPEV